MVMFVINGKLPGLNDLITAERTNKFRGAKLKREAENKIKYAIWASGVTKGTMPKTPITINYSFYEPNKKRDKDNIAGFAHKAAQDTLIKVGLIPNDGWAYIDGFTDKFFVDSKKPRIVVEIVEAEEKADE